MTEATPAASLRDYSADSRILYVSALAGMLGAISAVAAWMLLELIAICTNAFYFHRLSVREVDPWQAGRHWWSPLMPVLGGLMVGLIARYLSPRVRGHGMPEAVETIVFGKGRVQPRVAVLKPLATAISIGSGGPFGAEGPVIITGGAIGSVLGQLLPMTDSERTVLMVSGAAAGMAATFNCPMSATLLAVEILLFEWRPRSLVPVAIACVMAGAVRRLLLGPASIFRMPESNAPVYYFAHHPVMLAALAVGVIAAFAAAALSRGILFAEHCFEKIPIHWMWYPAIGGLGIGLGGLVFPRALGVGYSVIQQMISADSLGWKFLAGVLIVKSAIWIFSLGSNTAGGILAPLLMIGGALGAALGHFLPVGMTNGAWVIIGMTSVLSAAIGAPLTSAMLALELTHNGGLMLPVLLSCMTSYAVSVLVMSRSLLTAGMSARGLHLSREFGADPLETMLVGQAMHTSVFALNADATRQAAADWLRSMDERGGEAWSHWQRIFPLVSVDGELHGVLTRSQMIRSARMDDLGARLTEDAVKTPQSLAPGNTLHAAASAMAQSKLTSYPVVEAGKFVGVLTIDDLLKGQTEQTHRDSDRERVLRIRWPFRPAGVAQQEPVVPLSAAEEDQLEKY